MTASSRSSKPSSPFATTIPSPLSLPTMATMPLLTPTESYKFQSMLLDYSNGIAAPEWAMYTNDVPEDYSGHSPPAHREGNEQLTKATKDLISLDSNPLRWNESADRDVLTMELPASVSLNIPFRQTVPSPHPHHLPLHRFSYPPQHGFAGPLASLHRPPLTVTPSHTLDSSAASDSQQSLSSVSSNPTPPPPTPPSLKRAYPSSSDLSSLLGSGPSPSPSSSTAASSSRPQMKKHRASPPHQHGAVINAKPTLLTASQKKANHIQSEQKRRANIRRGYEALCDTVPSLREAILAEEKELAEAAAALDSKGKGKKKGRGKRGASELGEKLDGRAGPRSENVVLQKTIDYIHDLLEERKMLLERLDHSRCRLVPGHPATVPTPGTTLWEREWSGGSGILDDGDSDDEDEP